jgi:hypothetical protein
MTVDNNSIIDLTKTQCTKDCVDTNLSHDCATPTTFDKPRQQYFRERYVNMTPEERETKREQQRKSYRAPGRKEAKVASNKRRREVQDTSNYSFSHLHASTARSHTPYLRLENLLNGH